MTLSQVAKHQNFAPSLTESSAALSPGELHCYKTVLQLQLEFESSDVRRRIASNVSRTEIK